MRSRVSTAVRVAVAGAVLASGAIVMDLAPVSAHCPVPGQLPPGGRAYASAKQTLTVSANAIKGNIAYTNPTLCNLSGGPLAFSLEGISLCETGTCSDWVQVGWQKRQGVGSIPMLLCEYGNSGVAHGFWYAMSAAQHAYQWDYTSTSYWHCRLDGVDKAIVCCGWAHMTQGTYVNAQGETNSEHTQIGNNAPYKLGLFTLRWRKASTLTWQAYNLTLQTPDSPYGNSLPAFDYLANWTNAH